MFALHLPHLKSGRTISWKVGSRSSASCFLRYEDFRVGYGPNYEKQCVTREKRRWKDSCHIQEDTKVPPGFFKTVESTSAAITNMVTWFQEFSGVHLSHLKIESFRRRSLGLWRTVTSRERGASSQTGGFYGRQKPIPRSFLDEIKERWKRKRESLLWRNSRFLFFCANENVAKTSKLFSTTMPRSRSEKLYKLMDKDAGKRPTLKQYALQAITFRISPRRLQREKIPCNCESMSWSGHFRVFYHHFATLAGGKVFIRPIKELNRKVCGALKLLSIAPAGSGKEPRNWHVLHQAPKPRYETDCKKNFELRGTTSFADKTIAALRLWRFPVHLKVD